MRIYSGLFMGHQIIQSNPKSMYHIQKKQFLFIQYIEYLCGLLLPYLRKITYLSTLINIVEMSFDKVWGWPLVLQTVTAQKGDAANTHVKIMYNFSFCFSCCRCCFMVRASGAYELFIEHTVNFQRKKLLKSESLILFLSRLLDSSGLDFYNKIQSIAFHKNFFFLLYWWEFMSIKSLMLLGF